MSENNTMEIEETEFLTSPLSLEPYQMSIENVVDVVNKTQYLIQKYGLKEVLEVIEPIYEIYTASDLYLPEMAKTKKYIRSFHKLLKYHLPIINNILKVTKMLQQNSANGKVFVVEIDKASFNVPKLLIKVPLKMTSDPISYEYYIGMTLNQLRINGVKQFSLVYGRFRCGIDPNSISTLCANNTQISTHILYEYIESKKHIVKSMHAYINEYRGDPVVLMINIINILILLCVGLQKAQDSIKFTHYDLHLNNILLIELDKPQEVVVEYKSKAIKVYTNLIPYIIDYGRCHVDPDSAISDQDNGTFKDYETNVKYNTFKSYQESIWSGKTFRVKDNVKNMINTYISKMTADAEFSEYLKTNMRGKKIESFYIDNDTKEITYGIKPTSFHPAYDMYRMARTTCKQIMNKYGEQLSNQPNVWMTLDIMLQYAYPFYIPEHYVLPTNYKSLNGKFNTPIDMAKFLYSLAYKQQQIGGGREKMKNELLYRDNERSDKQMKNKLLYRDSERSAFQYYKIINDRIKRNLKNKNLPQKQLFDISDTVIFDTIISD
jgi:hypothetical protein